MKEVALTIGLIGWVLYLLASVVTFGLEREQPPPWTWPGFILVSVVTGLSMIYALVKGALWAWSMIVASPS